MGLAGAAAFGAAAAAGAVVAAAAATRNEGRSGTDAFFRLRWIWQQNQKGIPILATVSKAAAIF